MDDDRLASELQRRASGDSPRPEWAQRDLLPAVWREIDTRPQPVVTSRWSPGWSVAAVVAALLILVVAVPRLASQAPSATSTYAASMSPVPAGQITLTCDVPVAPGHCLQPVAWAVAHLPAGLARVTAVSIMEINLCPDASLCIGQPHYYEWWAAFTLRDGAELGMRVSNTMGFDTLQSAVLGASPPPNAEPVSGSFILSCGTIDDATCTGAAAGSTDLSPTKSTLTVSVEPLAGSDGHYSVNLRFDDGSTATIEVAPDHQRDIGWASVQSLSPVALDCSGGLGWPTRVLDQTGLVESCQRVPVPDLSSRPQLEVTNPGDDGSRLQVIWATSSCVSGSRLADVRVNGTPAFPDLEVTEYGVDAICYGPASYRGFEIDLAQAVPAAHVSVTFVTPHSTPAPSPTPSGQVAPRTLACGGDVAVVDETSHLSSCSFSISAASPAEGDLVIENPGGDATALQLTWLGNGCFEVHLSPLGVGYGIEIYRVSRECLNNLGKRTVTLWLNTPIRSDEITFWSIGGPPIKPSPSPWPSPTVTVSPPSGTAIECPTTNHIGLPWDKLHATIYDQTGLVLTCTKPKTSSGTWPDPGPVVINPGGDKMTLRIGWPGDPCDAQVDLVFSASNDGYTLTGRHTDFGGCIYPWVTHVIDLRLSAPIDASTVTAGWADEP